MAKIKAKVKPKLADKASDLIKQALIDLREIEHDARYVVDMNNWHRPRLGKCAVCFAGAILARAGNDPRRDIQWDSFGGENTPTARKLIALNNFRVGDVGAGLANLRAYDYTGMGHVKVADYEFYPGQFKRDMAQMARDLARQGF